MQAETSCAYKVKPLISIRHWQSRYKLASVLLGLSPLLAYWYLKLNIGQSLSAEAWNHVALVTALWSLKNLLVLVYFEYGTRTLKSSLQQHDSAEKARGLAQHDLSSLLNGVPYMLGYWDKTLHNRFSNKAYSSWFSVEPQALLGKHVSSLLSAPRLETAMPLINKALAGEPCEYLLKLNNKADDSPSHILVQYVPDVGNGQVNGFYAIGQDISEKHRAEQKLILRTKLLALTSTIAHVGSIVIDQSTTEVMLTPEAQLLLQTSQKSFPDLSAFSKQFVTQGQQEQVEEQLRRAVQNGEKLSLEFQASEASLYFGCAGESVMFEDKPSYLMCLMDITEATHTKKRLIEAKNKADQITAAKSQFVATMSHEIRNPLHTILGLCNLLNEQRDAETQKDITEKLRYCAEDLVDLLTNSLDSFRLDKGELHFENTEFDLWALVYGLSNHLYGGAARNGLELKIEFAGHVQRHWVGDAFRIKQMVGNLISNACKFTENGHIHLRLEQVEQGALQFTVTDTGPGIPAESVKNLFEQLAQSTPSTARLYGGSGLGLNLVKSLVENMGGSIQIASGEGEGTTARLHVPLTPGNKEDISTETLLQGSEIQLEISDPGWLNHTKGLLEHMACKPAKHAAPLLITDKLAAAHAHLEAHHSNHALILPTAAGAPRISDRVDLAARIFLVQGPLQPRTILKWLQSLENVFNGAPTVCTQTAKPVELVVLLVEDVKMTRMVIKKLLGKRGIRCMEAENGQKAVDMIKAHGDIIDFVLMDINMPVLNGIDATLQIRDDCRFSKLMVYALTGEDEFTTTHNRDWSVFNQVLSKPLKVATLEALLAAHRTTKAPAAYSLQ